jgi:hypothetical protein
MDTVRFNCMSCYVVIARDIWNAEGVLLSTTRHDAFKEYSDLVLLYALLLLPPGSFHPSHYHINFRLQLQLHLQTPPIDCFASHHCLISLGILDHSPIFDEGRMHADFINSCETRRT